MPRISKCNRKKKNVQLLQAINAVWYGGVLNAPNALRNGKKRIPVPTDAKHPKVLAERTALTNEREQSSHKVAKRLHEELNEGAGG